MIQPEHFGPYKVEKQIGKGGMGVVYQAVHVKSGQTVAVKVVSLAVGDSPKFRRRFEAEIETLMKLDHPNIVKLIGYGEERGQLFYSMDLVEGWTLQEKLRKVRKLTWEDALTLGIDICSALKHAHDSGVIHRDLKPANLLLSPDDHLKLTDFGIAKLFGSSEQTAAGAVLGTADYMAPEQAESGAVSPRTDLYALGSVLYTCLAGRSPFGGRQLTAVLQSLKHDPPPPLDLINPDIPLEIVEIINELLAKDPKFRPPTALATGNRLKALQVGLRERISRTAISVSDSLTMPEQEAPIAAKVKLTALDQTIASEIVTGTRGVPRDRDEELSPRTHYKDVEDRDRRRAAAPITGIEDTAVADWSSWISVIVLIVLLGLLIAGVWWSLQEPSADKLFTEIAAAEENGETEFMKRQVAQFIELYADDTRAEQVRTIGDSIDAELSIRQLENRANRPGGLDRLKPPELTLLQALRMRREHPQAAAEKLRQWLAVFDREPAGDKSRLPDPEVRVWRKVARETLAELEKMNPQALADRAAELQLWIDWGRENMSGDERYSYFQGLTKLFDDHTWAKQQISELRLSELHGSQEPAP